jgi:hypothetical protein
MFRVKHLAALGLFVILLSGLGCSNMDIPFIGTEEPKSPSYLHFNDVLIPPELNINRDRSFVFETGGFKAGTLILKGYVDPDSVADFFKRSMPNDGWTLKSIFRHPKTVLLFEKMGKSCIITIYESTLWTHVEVWVAPQVGQTSS